MFFCSSCNLSNKQQRCYCNDFINIFKSSLLYFLIQFAISSSSHPASFKFIINSSITSFPKALTTFLYYCNSLSPYYQIPITNTFLYLQGIIKMIKISIKDVKSWNLDFYNIFLRLQERKQF